MARYLMLLLIILMTLTNAVCGKRLTSISLAGVGAEKQSSILAIIPLTVGEEFTPVDIQKTIKKLYSTGRFRNISIKSVTETEEEAALRIELEENSFCDAVEFAGNKKLSKAKLKEAITLNTGDQITDAKMYENIVSIKRAYKDKGYLNAKIECDLIETMIPGYETARFKIKENERVRIEEISFLGNEAFTDKKLRSKLKTKKRGIFNSGEYDEILYKGHLDTLIQQFYNEKGYLDAYVSSDTVEFLEDSISINIAITINEGKQYHVGDFYFQNNDIIKTDHLASAVTMRKDKPFKKSKFQETHYFVGNVYRNEGYLYAQLEPKYKYRTEVTPKEDTLNMIDVIFDIVEGSPAIVRKINIEGNEKTREQVIRRRLRVYPGQKYSQSAVERSLRDVRQLNYFDNVMPDIVPNADKDQTVDLKFTVDERETMGQFSAGVSYSAQSDFGGNFNISIPNFRGAGEQLDANVDFSEGRSRYSLGFMRPWIFNRPISYSHRIFYDKTGSPIAERYHKTQIGTEFGFGKQFQWPDDYFSGSARYMFSYDKYFKDYKDQAELLGIELIGDNEEAFLHRFYLGLNRDDTDLPQFATRGSEFNVGSYFGTGDYNYVKTTVSYDWYQPLFWKFVLGTKSKLGVITSFNDKTKLGYNDLFQVGGVYYDGVVRGYNEADLGTDLTMMTLSSEVRFPLIDQQLYLGGFFDMGRSWNQLSEINFSEMYAGTGFGFRLMLPMIGLLGFDFAWALDDKRLNIGDSAPDAEFKGHFIMNRGF